MAKGRGVATMECEGQLIILISGLWPASREVVGVSGVDPQTKDEANSPECLIGTCEWACRRGDPCGRVDDELGTDTC